MKRLTNYLFFLDHEGKLERMIPMSGHRDTVESEAFVSALFYEFIHNQIQDFLRFAKTNSDKGNKTFSLGGTSLVMEFHSLIQADHSISGQMITFFEGNDQSPASNPSGFPIDSDSTENLNELSHEIKNSVNIIQGISELMKENVQTKSLDLMPHLDSSIKHLKSLVMNYLIHQKNKKVRWEKSNFNLRQEVEELVEQFTFLNKSEELRFEQCLDPRIPEIINGYPIALRQVLINLLFNALEHSQLGKVRLGVKLSSDSEESLCLNFAVEDSGLGYPFDFEEVSPSNQSAASEKTKKGFGLGLKICRSILSTMKSELQVQSEQGVGTRFSFDLEFSKPLRDTSSVDWDKSKSAELTHFSKKRVLIVDDNKINRLVASKYLNQLGFVTEEAEDGVTALQKIHESAFEIILLDIHLPVLDGISLLKILRPRFPKLKVILSSGINNLLDYLTPAQFGEVAFLEKPYSRKDLENILLEEFQD